MLWDPDNVSIGILFLRLGVVMTRKIQMNGTEDLVTLSKKWEEHGKEDTRQLLSEVVCQ